MLTIELTEALFRLTGVLFRPNFTVVCRAFSLFKTLLSCWAFNEGVVSKETVVLRRWGSSIQKFGFINGVDNVNWPPYRDSKS